MSVLLVDSDQIFRESVINLLLICGIEAYEVASTGEEALEKLSESAFEIVLINLSRPDIKGLQLADELQQRRSGSRIILILEDDQMPLLNDARLAELNFPTILKSSVNHMLPGLLSGD